MPRDLLRKEPQEKLEIKLCPDGSGQLYVPGLTEFRVQSVEDINKVWGDGGGGHRRVAAQGCSELRRGLWCVTPGFGSISEALVSNRDQNRFPGVM